MSTIEPSIALAFKRWLSDHGGGFHPHVLYSEVPSGSCVVAGEDLSGDTTVVRCPFELAVTEDLAQKALLAFLPLDDTIRTAQWSERQWISLYICFHWIIKDSSALAHYAYVKTLPAPEKLRTPLHFTQLELKMVEGTNLYGAALDREREWRREWNECYAVVSDANPEWGSKFPWEAYLTAATYLSSRAFPSSLLSPTPSLQSSPTTKPVLLPGIDSLNHARGQPVSWVVSYPDATVADKESPSIALVLHTPATRGQELLNNYGAKPNSELILGYGFSLSNNPDDTIVLKVGGINGKKWEVGRSARGADGLWDEIVHSIKHDPESPPNYEDHLDAAGALLDMIQTMLDRLPSDQWDHSHVDIRPEVAVMLHDYVEGQRDILELLIQFAHEKERLAVEDARAEGVEIVLED
ncbi:Ribosomal lysine N-methyltransferase set10 [Hypsizygus marmoreus]|uniref:Ribosomal lysine N-methyltransferase set10 n=1 Tax=Hypsizygus marmoreus TaxID=39966 RepID=A0A369JK81_HYPMA|nr:Ribosomal lysine N-methyltransferase set10 [Hypsizygus marmoreus]